MLSHAGGAAAIDAPVWLLAYGAAALVLLVTVTLRGRMVIAAADPHERSAQSGRVAVEPAGIAAGPGTRDDRPAGDAPGARADGGHPASHAGRDDLEADATGARVAASAVGHAVGIGLLVIVVAVALLGPAASAANLAPSAVLTVWWVGLPLACLVAGDVMAWLDPFGTLAGTLARPASGRTSSGPRAARAGAGRRAPGWTAAPLLALWAWWVLAYHDGRAPRALGWFVAIYTLAAVAGAAAWGRPWVRRGEAFGALSSTLARARRAVLGAGAAPQGRPGAVAPAASVAAVAALVAVWLGATAFDLFSGTRTWVDLAGDSTGWDRTGKATACLAVAIGLGALVVAGTCRLAAGSGRAGRGAATRVQEAVVLAWSAATAGVFVGHGIPALLLDGQFALSLASDPFGQGWDVFGTARRTIDYSPLSPGLVGAAQLAAAAGGAVWGVAAAARVVSSDSRRGGRSRLRALWVTGVVLAVAAAAGVAVLSADLE